MLVVMRSDATESDVQHVIDRIEQAGMQAHVSTGEFRTIIGALGDRERLVDIPLDALPGVERTVSISKAYKFVAREFHPEGTSVKVGDATVGRDALTMIAGPCSVENEEQAISSAKAVAASGAQILRGGAFKPRTSPYVFQGLGEGGLDLLAECKRQTGLPVVTEVLDIRDLERVLEVADCIQIGARNMQNFLLLREVGLQRKPVLLKRGFSNTIEELLMSAEYIAKGGNENIILCERGIRTFEPSTRATLDVAAIAVLRRASHLPIVVDPSHAAGRADLVLPLSLASVAAGADGLMVEIHPDPSEALSDGAQALTFEEFDSLMSKIKAVREAVSGLA
ncbi:MAG: 3-deoxy-7-phosphoheptulonate synthase [Actinomycetota bacterium]|nr:3-deoxy-7-phosphoheptulonate synthase [Actinomycetota bacterium]